MENILITGGAGFIGSRLALALVKQGHKITVLDNLSPQIHGKNSFESPLYKTIKDAVVFINGDVRIFSDWEKALEGQTMVVHFAAETGTGQSMYEISKYVDVNIAGTSHLLDYLANQDHKIKKVVVASSRAIYGEGKYFCEDHKEVFPSSRKEEEMLSGQFEPRCPDCNNQLVLLSTDESSIINPCSIYGITKYNQEQMVLLACKSVGVDAVALRYQNVYGPGQSLSNPYTGILSIFSTRILNNNAINIFEDGLESRDFVFIDDVVNGTMLAMFEKEAKNTSYNIGSGQSTSVVQVAESLKKAYRSDVNVFVSGNFRIGDIRHNKADITKANKELSFTPEVMFDKGIKLFSDWVKTQKIQKDDYDQSIERLIKKGLMK
jgi:dTDP-L-rhamnose 4-epimerase